MPEVNETKKRAVKGSRVSKSPAQDEEPKSNGKRGRPRVDAQDESAVERRRTQIRLAQRAYRERKETTISDLEKRVARLQQSLNEARDVVTSFRDRALTSGVSEWDPVVGLELQEMAHQVVGLAGGDDAGSDDYKAAAAGPPRGIQRSAPGSQPSLEPVFSQNMSDWLSTGDALPQPITTPLGYSFTYENSPEQAMDIDFLGSKQEAEPVQQTSQALQRFTPDAAMRPDFDDPDRFNPSIPLNLKPIYTYNFQESSFARRLTRESYERTYHMLTNPATSPERIHHMLRYSLCFGSIKVIAERIKSKLTRSKFEPLESWDLPVLHVNGAGLHFPRNGRDGGRPDMDQERNVGPFSIPRAEKPAPSEYYPYEIAQWIGLEGVWYDSYDVESFLKSRGLVLDGSSPTATIEIDESQLPVLDGSASSPNSISTLSFSGPQSPVSAEELPQDFFAPHVEEILANMSATDAFDLSSPMAFEDLHTSSTSPKQGKDASISTQMAIPNGRFQASRPSKRTVVIDVDRLIDALNQQTVCLGRSPGYKQEDVQKALDTVILEAY